jgi:hypothetical protein
MLPTRYEVEGTVLVQYTETSGAAYPIVADPKVSYGRYIYVRFTAAERREIAAAVVAAGGAAIGALLCAGAGPIFGGFCGIVGTVVAVAAFQAIYDSRVNRPHCGWEVRVNYAGGLAGQRAIRGDTAEDC